MDVPEVAVAFVPISRPYALRNETGKAMFQNAKKTKTTYRKSKPAFGVMTDMALRV